MKTQAAGPSQRQLRVAEEVRHALSSVFLRGEFRDPVLVGARITVTEVRASPDLKHMTAFVSGLGRDVPPEQFAALKRAGAFFPHGSGQGGEVAGGAGYSFSGGYGVGICDEDE